MHEIKSSLPRHLFPLRQAAEDNFKTKEVVMARGGIERYLRTFPTGGFWKGKNYLFDKRMEQTPELKSESLLKVGFNCVSLVIAFH